MKIIIKIYIRFHLLINLYYHLINKIIRDKYVFKSRIIKFENLNNEIKR